MNDATDELRRNLCERGVKYEVDDAKTVRVTRWRAYGDWVSFIEYDNGDTKFFINARRLTPEQVIIATLGTGTCRLVETEHEQEIFDGGYYSYWSYDCDECGHENTEYGRFCAGCGAKVVGE